ncbi:MAG: hypothetical protein IJ466_05900 [Clostridia bacterium]|nr:hypothetical protein [Clostridia bacterium]
MKIKVIIEKENWSEEAISEAMNDPRSIEEYEDFSERLELAALAWARKQKQDINCCSGDSEEKIAAYDISEGIEAYFYDCMVDNYIAYYVEELTAV